MANAAIPQPKPAGPAPANLAPCAWSIPRRILFRFLFCYFALYAMPDTGRISILYTIPGVRAAADRYIAIWHRLCPWVAIHVFHLSGQRTTYFPTGSGDTTLDYIQNLLFVMMALLATLLWSAADYKRQEYTRLESWLRVLVRYTLAFTLLGYGFAKVFPLQFRPPGFSRLIEPYGDFSPMGALWWFMGASVPYIIFSGFSEVTGGVLLLFRRTTTLGAMTDFCVLLNVAALNYCYDVPVKLYSTNLVLMCIYLAAGDLRRLANFFLWNRPTPAADLSLPRFERRWARISALVFQIVFVGYYLFSEIQGGWQGYKASYINPQRPPLYGLYEVDSFARSGQELPPLLTDATRWRRLIVQAPTVMSVRTMTDGTQSLGTEYDAGHGIVQVTIGQDKNKKYPLTYSLPDSDHLVLEGTLGNDPLKVRLRRVDISKYLLFSRGYHWINEFPFNR